HIFRTQCFKLYKEDFVMAKKGIFMSVTATAVIASAFVGAESADAASHKVKSGDNLWTLAKKYETSVTKLKKLNNLSGDMIYVNQVLEVGDKGKANSSSANSSKKSSSNKTSTSKSSGGTYTVKSGDTLRSEERRVGKECRYQKRTYHEKNMNT